MKKPRPAYFGRIRTPIPVGSGQQYKSCLTSYCVVSEVIVAKLNNYQNKDKAVAYRLGEVRSIKSHSRLLILGLISHHSHLYMYKEKAGFWITPFPCYFYIYLY